MEVMLVRVVLISPDNKTNIEYQKNVYSLKKDNDVEAMLHTYADKLLKKHPGYRVYWKESYVI